eukprot:4565602-Amphidinium_carterae.2
MLVLSYPGCAIALLHVHSYPSHNRSIRKVYSSHCSACTAVAYLTLVLISYENQVFKRAHRSSKERAVLKRFSVPVPMSPPCFQHLERLLRLECSSTLLCKFELAEQLSWNIRALCCFMHSPVSASKFGTVALGHNSRLQSFLPRRRFRST